MTTLSDIRTQVSRDLRDTGNDTFSPDEVDDLINQGIDAVSALYPREVRERVTISSGVKTYDLTADFVSIFRVDIYDSGDSFRFTLDAGTGPANSGWEYFAGLFRLPPSITWTAGDKADIFGYARYVQLSASSSTTDMDSTAIWGVRAFARAEAFQNLIADRSTFQQWQAASGNSDVTAIALAQLAANASRRWDRAQQRLRRPRRTG